MNGNRTNVKKGISFNSRTHLDLFFFFFFFFSASEEYPFQKQLLD
jgi:hypothetical protein